MGEGGLGGYDEPATIVFVYNGLVYNLGMTALLLWPIQDTRIPTIYAATTTHAQASQRYAHAIKLTFNRAQLCPRRGLSVWYITNMNSTADTNNNPGSLTKALHTLQTFYWTSGAVAATI